MGWRVPYIVTNEEAKDKRRFFKIPIPVLEKVVEHNLFAPFRFFMYCKTVSNGQMRICPNTIRRASADLGISERTVKRHLEILQNRNWIGRFKSGGYIIRGFDKIRAMEKTTGRTAVWFDAKQHLKPFREFVVSACLGQLAKRQRTKLWKERRLPGSRRGTPRERKRPFPKCYPVACEAMKQIYGISIGTAFNWKESAHKAGFISVYKRLRPVRVEWTFIYPELEQRLVKRGNRCFIQLPDKIKCNLKFTRCRCLHALDKN